MSDLIIQKVNVLTGFSSHAKILIDQDIWIRNGRIDHIEPTGMALPESAKVIAGNENLAIPGLINGHTHFYSAFAKGISGICESNNFLEVLNNLWWKLDWQLTREASYYSSLLGIMEALSAGSTCVFDHHSAPNAPDLDPILRAMTQSGIRGSLSFEVTDRNGVELAEKGLKANADCLESLESSASPDRLKAMVGLHASFTLSETILNKAVKLAQAHNTGIHIHVAEDRTDQEHCLENFGCRVIERLDRAGALNSKTLAAHGTHLTAEELSILAQRDSFLVHNPQSNMNNAVGAANLAAWKQHGVPYGLGTDAMTYRMLEEARTAVWLQKHNSHNPSFGFDLGINPLIHGNYQLAKRFWSIPLGELVPSASADIALFDYHPGTPLTQENIQGHLLFGLSQCRVSATIVEGKLLYYDGKFPTLDPSTIITESKKLAKTVWDAMQ